MELYKKDVYKKIQEQINNGDYKIRNFQNYIFLIKTPIYNAGVKYVGQKLEHNKVGLTLFMDDAVSEHVEFAKLSKKNWMKDIFLKTPIGYFLKTDLIKNKRDEGGVTPYYEMITTLDGNPCYCILRRLYELVEDEIPNKEFDILKGYCNLTIDNYCYALIKVTDEVSSNRYSIKDKFACELNVPIPEPTKKKKKKKNDDDGNEENDNEDEMFEQSVLFEPSHIIEKVNNFNNYYDNDDE